MLFLKNMQRTNYLFLYKVQDHRQNFYIFIRFWKNKREQMNQQKGSLKHMKKSAPEVMTSSEASSSEAPHQKQGHQKLKFIRR